MTPIYLALIDDQKLFRQSLAMLLGSVPSFELVAVAESGRQFLETLTIIPALPHIVLMDMEMPDMDGIELQKALREKYPSIKVIVLSVHAKERLIARMIQAGSSGYLVKNCDKEELVTAIHSVHDNGFYINAQVLKAIQTAPARSPQPETSINHIPVDLSEREKQVLRLICQEFSNAEIASRLFISVRTAEGHRNNLLAKTGCCNTAGLVLFAVKYHIYEVVY